MYYIKWTPDDIKGMEDEGITALYTEIDSDGNVCREIGLDNLGRIVHMCPADSFRLGTYGLFDNQRVDISQRPSNITHEEFERLWNKKNIK